MHKQWSRTLVASKQIAGLRYFHLGFTLSDTDLSQKDINTDQDAEISAIQNLYAKDRVCAFKAFCL